MSDLRKRVLATDRLLLKLLLFSLSQLLSLKFLVHLCELSTSD